MSASDIKRPALSGGGVLGHFLRKITGGYAMNSPSISFFSRTLVSILFAASLILTPKLVKAQDYTEEEYKLFQDVQAEKDDAKKVDTIAKFLKEKPKNGLRPNMIAEYQKVLTELKNEKKWNQIITLGEKFYDAVPGDDLTEALLAAAYSETGNAKGFVSFGEKVYASKPSAALAMEIARNYQKLGNEAKSLQWKEKVLAADPNNFEILADTMKRYAAAQNMAQAVKYAKNTLSALPTAKKPAGTDEANWKAQTDQTYAIAYGILGQDAYQNRRYSEAIKNLEAGVKYFKRNDAAYATLGLCYWQVGKMDAAMLNFAKAYVIRGAQMNMAKQNLDKLWKDTHKGTLAGQERIIERATTDLK
jgi:tetratricopeptide (TPR) repeat protein